MKTTTDSEISKKINFVREKLSEFPKLKDGMNLAVGSITESYLKTTERNTPIRVYSPRTQAGPHPAVFYFHGGGFCLSSYADDEPMARQLANEANCAVFSVDYGLAPEYPFPSALEEAYSVIKTVIEQAAEYNIDRKRIAVAGNSAGANLAIALCIISADRQEFSIQALSAIYPPLDLSIAHQEKLCGKAEQSSLRAELMELLMIDAYLEGDRSKLTNPLVSPLYASDYSVFPSTLLVSAERCPFTPEHSIFFERLKAAGVECLHKLYSGVDHGFMDMGGEELLQRDCKALISAQLKSIFGRFTAA